MWIEVIAGFLVVSILFYSLFAGADFGAGILEFCSDLPWIRARDSETVREGRIEILSHALGPVWEANHVWLILAVVILFNGFPRAFSSLSVLYHIPLTLILLGVILRGCAFTFRHYDAVRDQSQAVYSRVFQFSSLLTPFFLGVVGGSLVLNPTLPNPEQPGQGFGIYLHPWLNTFCFAVGVFTCALFAFLAAVYLIGETEDPKLRQDFIRWARVSNGVAVLAGGGVFLSACFGSPEGVVFLNHFIHDPIAIGCMGLATAILWPLWRSLYRQHVLWARVFSAGQVVLILLGWVWIQSPRLVGEWTLYNAAAPDSTLYYLVLALGGGSVVIFPSLFYLLRVFKAQ